MHPVLGLNRVESFLVSLNRFCSCFFVLSARRSGQEEDLSLRKSLVGKCLRQFTHLCEKYIALVQSSMFSYLQESFTMDKLVGIGQSSSTKPKLLKIAQVDYCSSL